MEDDFFGEENAVILGLGELGPAVSGGGTA